LCFAQAKREVILSEGEHLGKLLKKAPWKGAPQKVIALYLKIILRSLLFFLSTSGKDKPEGSKPNYSAKAKYYDITDSELVP
jgi:hypothetical protein